MSIEMNNGQIIQLLGGFYDVLTPKQQVVRTRARGNFRNKKTSPVVGDLVEFKQNDDDTGYITEIKSRKNLLVRPPLANIDQAVVVTATKEPDFSTNLLDRQLVALAEKNITVIIYFSKTDLLTENEFSKIQAVSAYYEKMGYQIILEPKSFSDRAIQTLKSSFNGQLTIFMGQTGAGKSTLLNKIDPSLGIETGEVSKALSRGKHTTRKVSLLNLNGGLVADTPGFSTYSVFEMNEKDLKEYFKDFIEFSPFCQFRECLHINEPGCAVKAAVADKKILKTRYNNYLQFIELIRKQKPEYKRPGYQKKNGRK